MLPVILPEEEVKIKFLLNWTEKVIDTAGHLPRYTAPKQLICQIDYCIDKALKKFRNVPDWLPDILRVTIAKLYNIAFTCDKEFKLFFDIKRKDDTFEVVPCNIQTLIFMHNKDRVPTVCNAERYETKAYIYQFRGNNFKILDKSKK